jgi:decaprenylphospho-beta-D-erythro-pentofuranosid-2-ulose 2-reductase
MNGAQPARTPRRVVILGALSAIAEAAARDWARRGGARLMLAGRDAGRLEAVAADLRLRGAEVETFAADLATADAAASLAEMSRRLGGIDVVLVAYGVLGDQTAAEADPREAKAMLRTNFTSAAAWCLAAANVLEAQRSGSLIVLGSVAGDRGRASNYIYGAAKAGLGVLTQGLAHRLAGTGARAVVIKPGFVDTPMTAHIGRKGPLWASADTIGRRIAASAERDAAPVLYAPFFWRWIMLAIRITPSPLFHRTRL